MATPNLAAQRYMNGMDQAAHRGHALWYDQHRASAYRTRDGLAIFEMGRPYYSIIELATRMPVGPVFPLGWEAPFVPPQQYIIRSIGKITNVPVPHAEGLMKTATTDRFHIDYQRMKTDDHAATQEHFRLAVATAAQHNLPMPKPGRPMDARLLVMVGSAPRSPKIAEACQSGDLWILGQKMPTRNAVGQHVVEPNEELERLLSLNREEQYMIEAAEREEASAAATALDSSEFKALRQQLEEEIRLAREARLAMEAGKAPARRGRPPKGKGAAKAESPVPATVAG